MSYYAFCIYAGVCLIIYMSKLLFTCCMSVHIQYVLICDLAHMSLFILDFLFNQSGHLTVVDREFPFSCLNHGSHCFKQGGHKTQFPIEKGCVGVILKSKCSYLMHY